MKKVMILLLVLLLVFVYSPVSFSIRVGVKHDKAIDLPEFFSWRDVNGTDYTTPIKDQSPAPSCEAYALVAALETMMQYKLRMIYYPDLSETHLYFYAGGTYKAGYVNLVDAANYLVEHGVPDEGCFPDPHRPYDFPFESLPGWENRTVKIRGWGWVDHDMYAMKKALIEHGPLVVCMIFWRDFYYYHGGVYRHRWGRVAGGHVMAIVGYDDQDRCWIIKNSWGTGWGEHGWLRISYDDLWIGEWYGEGTGVMYLDGVYGNLKPDVPKVDIVEPKIFHNYIYGYEFPVIFRKMPFIQKGAPRIIGSQVVRVEAENTNKVEFYLDDELEYVDEDEPYEWVLKTSLGLHTIKVLAYNERGNISEDVMDVFVFG